MMIIISLDIAIYSLFTLQCSIRLLNKLKKASQQVLIAFFFGRLEDGSC